jgi:hypothetical protein
VLYAINPMILARHRKTLIASRAKSDKSDAYHLALDGFGAPLP